MQEVYNLEPQAVFRNFHAINQIPRGSNNEAAISQYLLEFGRKLGLEAEQDEALNVIIRKAATPGYEAAPTVIIQGHMDMVCEKTATSQHDFTKDPIPMIIDGDILRTAGTTLGGDDGVAVAYAMALLESDCPHPALEIFLTTAEETGMDGAMALKKGQLQGTRLINIDGEEEGTFTVSCAGGGNVKTTFPVQFEPVRGKQFQLDVSGLLGGHSGLQIALGRGNALKIMARILADSLLRGKFQLLDLSGGSKHNAIPSWSKASIALTDESFLPELTTRLFKGLCKEFASVEPGLTIELKPLTPETCFESAITATAANNLLDYLFLCPDQVQSMSPDIPNLVRTSVNTAVLSRNQAGFELLTSVRSSVLSSRQETIGRLLVLAERLGAVSQVMDSYPAWEYEVNSPFRDIAISVYEQLSGKKAKIEAIHAGLECGLFKEVLPDCDMISIGADLYDVHTPKEHLSIASMGRVYNYLLALLAALH